MPLEYFIFFFLKSVVTDIEVAWVSKMNCRSKSDCSLSHFPWTCHPLPQILRKRAGLFPTCQCLARSCHSRQLSPLGRGCRELSVECPGNRSTDVQKAHPGSKETAYLLMISMNKIQIEDC